MRRMPWCLLWLGATISLAGCYGDMEPGSAAAPGSSMPIDTTRYAPTETPTLVYRRQQQQLHKPLPSPVTTDSNVTKRVRTPRLRTYRPALPPPPDATTVPATRSVQEATDRELQALSPVGKLPPSPVPRVAAETAPTAAPAGSPTTGGLPLQ